MRKLKNIRENKFDIDDVQIILKQKLTLGELFANSFRFQGTRAVNNAASELLGIDFFSTLSELNYETKLTTCVRKGRKKVRETKTVYKRFPFHAVLSNCGDIIDRCFQIRHECVHDTGSRFKMNKGKVMSIFVHIEMFNLMISTAIILRLREICGLRKIKH